MPSLVLYSPFPSPNVSLPMVAISGLVFAEFYPPVYRGARFAMLGVSARLEM